MTNQQLRYFYHWPHFLYRIGYWITYQIECLIKEIMFEWVRDKLQTMLDLEMWAHLKMNKKHQIKTLGALPCTFCPVISKIALYLSLCFFCRLGRLFTSALPSPPQTPQNHSWRSPAKAALLNKLKSFWNYNFVKMCPLAIGSGACENSVFQGTGKTFTEGPNKRRGCFIKHDKA